MAAAATHVPTREGANSPERQPTRRDPRDPSNARQPCPYPLLSTALPAYSTWKTRPCGDHVVESRSYLRNAKAGQRRPPCNGAPCAASHFFMGGGELFQLMMLKAP